MQNWLSQLIRKSFKVTRLQAPLKNIDQPLFSSQQIASLYQELEGLLKPWQVLSGVSAATQQGILQSRTLGSGIEYAESQPYQPGDDIRFLDWRLMAKRGQAFSKWFEPEKQETWSLFVDLSATMRFGTKQNLKAGQAAKAFLAFSLLAQKRQSMLKMVKSTEQLSVSEWFGGAQLFEQALQFVNQSCPPMTENSCSVDFSVLLSSLTEHLPLGTHLLLISDFHRLDQAILQHLTALSQHYDVTAIFIEDWSERHLPLSGQLKMQSVADATTMAFDQQQQAEFQSWSEGFLNQKQQAIQACGVRLLPWRTDQSLAELLHLWEASQ